MKLPELPEVEISDNVRPVTGLVKDSVTVSTALLTVPEVAKLKVATGRDV